MNQKELKHLCSFSFRGAFAALIIEPEGIETRYGAMFSVPLMGLIIEPEGIETTFQLNSFEFLFLIIEPEGIET